MIGWRGTFARNTRCVALASTAAACLFSSAATAETYATVDASVGATVASNPFLIGGDDLAAVGANLTVAPRIEFEDVNTTFVLDGRVSLDQYLERYGTEESVSLGLTSNHQIDERNRLSGGINFRSSRSVSQHQFLLGEGGAVDLEPGEFPESSSVDPTLGGVGGRIKALGAHFSLDRVLGPTSNLTVSGDAGWTWVQEGFAEDYRDAMLAVGYNKRLSETTVAIGRVEGKVVDYLGQHAGDATMLTALGGVERQLSETISLSALVGGTWVRGVTNLGNTDSSLALSARVDLCSRGEIGIGCISASHRVRPTASGGVSPVTTVGLSYSREISVGEQIALSATYARSGNFRSGPVSLGAGRSNVFGATASYSRRFADRLSAFISPSISSVSEPVLGRRENYQARLGISYRFGRDR